MTRAQFLIIFLFALAVRLAHTAWLLHDGVPLLAEDANYYWSLGEAILAHGGHFMHDAGIGAIPESERMPLYPYLLAGIRGLGGGLGSALCVNAILDSVTCTVIAAIAGKWSPRAGLISGILAALSPSLIIHAGMILTESLFMLPLSIALYGCVAYLADPGPRPAVLTGLSLGIATLARAVTLPMIFVLTAVAPLIALIRNRGKKSAVLSACAIAFCALAILSPLSVRNMVVLGSPALNSQSGNHLTLWILPLLLQQETGRPFGEITSEINKVIDRDFAARGYDDPKTNLMTRSEAMSDIGWAMLKDISLQTWITSIGKASIVNLGAPAVILHPSIRALSNTSFYETAGSGLVDRIIRFLSHADPRFVTAIVVGCIGSVVMSALSLAGLVLLFRAHPWAATFAVLYILYFSLLNGPVLSPKYRLPMEPVLIALAAIAVESLVGWFTHRSHIKNVITKK